MNLAGRCARQFSGPHEDILRQDKSVKQSETEHVLCPEWDRQRGIGHICSERVLVCRSKQDGVKDDEQ